MNKFIALSCFLLSIFVVNASESIADSLTSKNSNQGKIHVEVSPTILDTEGMPGYFDVQWKQWVLLGEPVFNSKIFWGFIGYKKFLFKDMNGKKVNLYPSEIPEEVLREIFIVELDIEGRIDAKALRSIGLDRFKNVYFEIDTGVLGKPAVGNNQGTENYNTPGSPDWKKLFYQYSGDEKKYLSEKQAKIIVKHGFEAVEVLSQVTRLDVSIHSVKAWYNDQLKEKQLKKLQEKQQRESQQLAAKHENRERRYRASQNKSAPSQDDFLAELDAQLAEIDMEEDRQREKNNLEIKHQHEITEIQKTAQNYRKDLEKQNREYKIMLQAKKDEVAGHVLPAEELEPFFDSKISRHGYKNAKGDIVIKPTFVDAKDFQIFNKKYALVSTGSVGCNGAADLNNNAIIDRKGKIVTPNFLYNSFPGGKRAEVWVLKSYDNPRKVYANEDRDNLRNKYLKWEYQTKMRFEVIEYDSNFNRIGSRSETSNENGHWYWLEECFGIEDPDAYESE